MRTVQFRCALAQSQPSFPGALTLKKGTAWQLLSIVLLVACPLELAAQPPTSRPSAPPTTTQPAPPATQPKQPAPTLPPDFRLPPAKPAIIDLKKELLTEEDAKTFLKIERDYKAAMRNGVLDPKAQRDLSEGLRYRVLAMSLDANRNNLRSVLDDLLREIRSAGQLQTNVGIAEQFRNFILKEVVDHAAKLLDNNFYVRLNATILLSELNLKEADRAKKQDAVPYIGAAQPLLSVLNDPEQPQAVKIQAAKGLGRISTVRNLKPDLKLQVAQSLVQELQNRDFHYWYQMVLANSLSGVDVIYDRGVVRKPFVIDALMKALMDSQRHWLVRAEAAKSLGRVPLDREINVSLIAYEIARMTEQMAQAQRKNAGAFYWKNAFLTTYLAFQPVDDDERSKDRGLLTKVDKNLVGTEHGKKVQDAYQQIVPLVSQMLNLAPRTPLPETAVNALSTWVTNNPPQNSKLTPESDPITRSAAPVVTVDPTASTTSN